MIFDFNNDGREDLLDWLFLDSLEEDEDELDEECDEWDLEYGERRWKDED